MSDNWVVRKRPARLERRIDFADYEKTRDFLDRAAELAESRGYYPDMSFGRTHVCITLSSPDDTDEVSEDILQYARQMDALVAVEAQAAN